MSISGDGPGAGRDAEVIVVGGGPAGSATAIHLARSGHRVMLLDKARFPRHKACSEYINPSAVPLLGDLGVLDDIMCAGADRMQAMVVHAPNGERFTANYERAQPGQAALGISRYRLDQILLDAAKAAGAEVIERAHVRDVLQEDGRVAGVVATIGGTREELRAPLVIGADGHNSVVSRSLDLDAPVPFIHKTGLVAHYRDVTGLDQYGEMHVGHGLYGGFAVLEDGLTNFTLVSSSRNVAARSGSIEEYFEAAIQTLPEVARKLEGATRVGTLRGVGGMAHRARRTTGDGFMLVGDAASFLDPFTGEGVHDALKGAMLAAPVATAALRAGDTSRTALEPYRRARREAFTAKRQVCWIVQGFVNAPPLMNYVTDRLATRENLGLTLSGVLGNFRPATQALSPVFLVKLLRP
jgi:geranylgeranyl reductase family protein